MTRLHLFLALCCGLVVRGGCLAGVEYSFERGDAASYRTAALTLIDHGVYSFSQSAPFEPTAYRPPGYTAFLALVALLSRAPLAVQLTQVLVSLGCGLLLFLIARRLAPGSEQLVLWVCMLNPFDAVYASAGLSECLTTGLLVSATAALVLLDGSRRVLCVGVLMGGLCLFRDIYLALIPFGAGLYLLAGLGKDLRTRLGQVAAVAVLAACVVTPWTVRNFAQLGRLIPISAGRLGYSLWMGTWATDGSFTASDATGRVYPEVAFLKPADREAVLGAGTDVAASEPVYKRLFAERIAAEPGRVIWRWLVRWPRLWLGTRFDIFELNRTVMPQGSVSWLIAKAALFGLNALFLVGAAIGAVFSWRGRSAVLWVLVPIAFSSLVYLPLNSFENRYSQPMFPFLTLLLGFGAVSARTSWLNRKAASS